MINRMRSKPSTGWAGSLLILLAVASVAVPAGAVPQIMTAYGDQMPWLQADINAMGGTGTALYRGGMSNMFNPAFLVWEEGSRLDAGVCLDQEHEDRFQPLFDTFESYVTDAAIATNREHYWNTGFGAATRLGHGERPVVVGIALADRYPFQYRFWEELRNPSPYTPGSGEPARDQIIAQREREVTGTLRDLSVGVGYGVDEIISIGAAAHYAFGTRKDVMTERDLVDEDNSYNNIDEFEMNGVNFTVGLRGRVNERIEVGLAWESQLNVDGDRTVENYANDTGATTTDTWSSYVRYPNRYRAGLTFRPRTDPRTVFTMEVELVEWSELADSEIPGYDNPQNLKDGKDVRIGLEHTFYNGMPIRFGFRHFDSFADREVSASVFSAGVGMPLGGGMLSGSLELSKLTAVLTHQFSYPEDYFGDAYYSDPQARVEDTRFRVGVGYSVNF